jgi:hypothetical protein
MATPTTLPAAFVSGNVLTAAQLNDLRGAFRVLQVVSTTKTDTFSTSSTTYTDVTGLTATITPSSTSSKILVVATCLGAGTPGSTTANFRLARGGTGIAIGDAGASNQIRVTSFVTAVDRPESVAMCTLDSPSTTSATTYSVQMCNEGQSTAYLNRSQSDGNFAANVRGSSTITVMEISA